MDVLDYSRSFVTFVTHGRENNARIQLEARCVLVRDAALLAEVSLVASCKSEHTYAHERLFQDPNYDFCVLFSADRYRILRTPLLWDPALNESGRSAERFEEVIFTLTPAAVSQALESPREIVLATLAGRPLVARTVFGQADGTQVILEYPVKTMNVNDRDWLYQVDTGPVALPLGSPWTGDLEDLELAFVAFSGVVDAEFVVRRPTVPHPESPAVSHYGGILPVPAHSTLHAVG